MIEQKEAAQIIEEVRTAVKDWRKVSSELQIPQKILAPYCSKWDNL
jgi:hypothetical protein